MHALKYRGLPRIADDMAVAMNRVAEVADVSSVLVPIPLAPKRVRQRGYNQSERIVRHMVRSTGIADDGLLLRTRFIRPQVGLNMHERRANVGRPALDPVDAHADGATGHGVHNMIGNVAEWTASPAALYPSSTARVEPRGVVVRGGSLRSEPAGCSE